MDLIIKQILIIAFTFFITLWLQSSDDKKYKNERITFYEKYKLPIFFSALVGLILNIFDILNDDKKIFSFFNFNDNKINHKFKKPLSINNAYNQEIYIEPFLNLTKH
jgi:hypothetical protein